MTTEYESAVLRAAMLKILSLADEERRDEIRDTLNPGDRKTVYLDDGDTRREIGTVLRTKPKPAMSVIDHEAFGRWVDEHCPEAIVTTRQVNPSWRQRVLRAGHVEVLDPETGELREMVPDGIGIISAPSQLRISPNEHGEALALTILNGVKELEP